KAEAACGVEAARVTVTSIGMRVVGLFDSPRESICTRLLDPVRRRLDDLRGRVWAGLDELARHAWHLGECLERGLYPPDLYRRLLSRRGVTSRRDLGKALWDGGRSPVSI